ncbi:MAG TPA: cytochrome c [Candidatus Kapabacteria bacterium]|nr:cytochrome c [Candidatus Kapabacteria bacterium]
MSKAKTITNYELRITNYGWNLFLILSSSFLILNLSACRQDMQDQPKYLPYRGSEMFADSNSSRPLVKGTVPRGYLREDSELYTGKSSASAHSRAPGDTGAVTNDVNAFPFPITREVLDRGQERFNIYCSPCHGVLGDGRGMIANRGFSPPPTYHQDRLRNAPLGHFFDVITNGFGRMPDYSMQIPPHERWAIIAYIRALQLSQNANVADVPPSEISKLK